MRFLSLKLVLLGIVTVVNAGDKHVTVVNNCDSVVTVGVLTNGRTASSPDMTFDLTPKAERLVTKQDTWGGRIWGRQQCSGSKQNSKGCGTPGASNPATLAEFFFKGAFDKDFYDISFVDGYNLPMSIQPQNPESSKGYNCGSPTCADVPTCPDEYAVKGPSGQLISCLSSCSKTNSPETCCTGDSDHPDLCKPDARSDEVKKACPDAYSFAYDDQKSTFECTVQSYTVAFC
ncbi:thaumatin [Phycomyces nitens]|nr:thaumatin [Phycomyces nitens]